MTAAECEIVADAACHLKAIAARMLDRKNVSEIAYVLGMLGTLPLESEGDAIGGLFVRLYRED